MISFLKTNAQLIVLLLIWIVAGSLMTESAFLLVPLGFVILKRKERYAEIVIAFALILCLADNYSPLMNFAKETKDIALLILAFFFFFDQKQFQEKSKIFVPFVFFLVLAIVLSYKSPVPDISFQKSIAYALLLISVPNYFLKELNENAEFFLRNLIWFYVTFLVLGFMFILVPNNLTFIGDRFNGLLGNPNGIGILCTLLVILITVSQYHYPNLFKRNELYFIYSVIILNIFMSNSRNCMFTLLIFLFFIRFYRISYFLGFVIVIISSILYWFLNEHFVDIVMSLGLGEFLRVEHLENGSGRTVAWAFAWREIQDSFFLGRGFDYDHHFFEAHKMELRLLGHYGGVHNTYLAVWMNTGLIGLILFLYGFLTMFFKAAKLNYLAIPSMFAIMFEINFESWAISSLSAFTIVFLLVVTLLQFKKNEAPAEENFVPVL